MQSLPPDLVQCVDTAQRGPKAPSLFRDEREAQNRQPLQCPGQRAEDPVELLHFLGFKVEGFWHEPFESVEALYDYVTTSRLFFVRPAPEEGAEGDANGGAGVVGGEEGRKKLKANDRRRMKGRPVYRRWINEFIPELRAQGKFLLEGPGTSIDRMRAELRDEAFALFFVEAEYMGRLRDWRLKRSAEEMKTLIKGDGLPADLAGISATDFEPRSIRS